MLEKINHKFNLDHTKILATVTDNGSNFVKCFKEFGITVNNFEDNTDEAEIVEEVEEIQPAFSDWYCYYEPPEARVNNIKSLKYSTSVGKFKMCVTHH